MAKLIINSFKIGLIIVGTTIGAGFASGREIWEFFSSYGHQSIKGILLSIILLGISSIFILWISYENKTTNYYDVLNILMGAKLAKMFDVVIFLYLFSGALVMFAGSGATFKQWDLSYTLGVVIMAVLVWLVLIKGMSGLIKMNTIIIPALTVILLYVNYQFLINNSSLANNFIRSHLNVWPSAITYSSLNLISLLGVLSTLGGKISSKWEIILGGVIGAITLGLVATSLNMSLLRIEYVQQYEIPLFSLISNNNRKLLIIVTIVLWLAIYTTVLSNVYGLVNRIKSKISYSTASISLLIIMSIIPLSFIGFSTLVNILYPIYGVLNLYILAVLLLYPFQTKK